MSKTKKMNHKEMKAMLKRFSQMSLSEKEAFAKMNHMSVEEIRVALERNCYRLCNLGINQLKELRKEIPVMTDEELKMVERVNEKSIEEILSEINADICVYEENMRKQRAFNKAWELRKAEVQKQLIVEGIDKVESYGCLNINFVEHTKRMYEAQIALAKEIGIPIKNFDSMFGPTGV